MNGLDFTEVISHLVMYIVVLLLAISAHEAGHAWMSWKFGDDTAYMLGRVTLNPVAHTDPIGTLLIPIVSFLLGVFGGALANVPLIGWGIPTPVNPRNWTRYKLANVMVSVAGVLMNIALAVSAVVVWKLLIVSGITSQLDFQNGVGKPIAIFFTYMIKLNISLFIFNLLPFPPLDGSKILSTFLPASFQPMLDLLEQWGFMILMLLMYWGVIRAITSPIFQVIDTIIEMFLRA
jgi:Zn-dependent protease